MNPALIATFANEAEKALRSFGCPLTLNRVGQLSFTVVGVIRAEMTPFGEYGELMETRRMLTVAASADVKIGDTLIYLGKSYRVAQIGSNDGFRAVYALQEG